uniref:Reverse transcriptase domain-containing protein n=1 Tax=Eutreptiella gymnastica TaxID=73025 RepID=A0A7S1N9C1_9EUGL|mmetsp:Transcript_137670/g.239350  ORF Transcript_137670/g.239350 Transcript_137670/m.239350 type:complete len:675 (+) Transcript_137670:626-2650(+)
MKNDRIKYIAKRIGDIHKNNTARHDMLNFDLYKLIKDRDLLIASYESIKSNKGSLSLATSLSKSIDGFNLDRIERLNIALGNESWTPRPARRVYIPKSNKKNLRPLGIQGVEEKLVQSNVKFILEAIYEPIFNNQSHGFRPKRGCHSALKSIDQTYDGIRYVVEGDIKGMFDNVHHGILLQLLRKKIKDEKFIRLIQKLLNAGYMEKEPVLIKPLTGTPQGSIVSPILSNIYLHELDIYMQKTWITSNKNTRDYTKDKTYASLSHKIKKKQNEVNLSTSPSDRKNKIKELKKLRKRLNSRKYARNYTKNKTYASLSYKIKRKQNEINLTTSPLDRESKIKELKRLRKERLNHPFIQETSKNIRVLYIRYADDFIVGVSGPLSLANKIKSSIGNFIKKELALELSEEKTLVTDINRKPVLFLGYNIRIDTSKKIKKVHMKGRTPFMRRTTGTFVRLEAPLNRIIKRLALNSFCDSKGFPTPKRQWVPFDDYDIIKAYNSVYLGYLGYYSGAHNINSLYRIRYIMKFSLAMTIASKHRSSINKLFKKHGPWLKLEAIPEKGIKEIQFYNKKLNKKNICWQTSKTSFRSMENYIIGKRTRSKLDGVCCICGNASVHNHHIRHVRKQPKNRQKTFESLMGLINRKQIPVCHECHVNIHAGRYDGKKLSSFIYPDLAKQ